MKVICGVCKKIFTSNTISRHWNKYHIEHGLYGLRYGIKELAKK